MIKKLFPYLREFKKDAILSPLLIVLEAVCELFLPLLMANIIDDGINGTGGMDSIVRNGVLMLQNSLITTNNDQVTEFSAVGELKKDRNWFMKFVRFVFKGEQLEVSPEDTIYIKVLKPIKVDLTNGWIFE